MSASTNRFGLTRSIPANVALSVRRRCGFGCVVCGSAVYEYDHFLPEFKDAKSHDPNGIVLLCPNHHRAKGSLLSIGALKKCADMPYCKTNGFSHIPMEIDNLTVELGPLIARHCKTVLEVSGGGGVDRILHENYLLNWNPIVFWPVTEKVVWFEPPEEEGAPLRLNVILNDEKSAMLGLIINNDWEGSELNADIITISRSTSFAIQVKNGLGNKIFDLELFPGNTIKLTKFVSYHNKKFIEISGSIECGYVRRDGKPLLQGAHINVGNAMVAISV